MTYVVVFIVGANVGVLIAGLLRYWARGDVHLVDKNALEVVAQEAYRLSPQTRSVVYDALTNHTGRS